MAKVNIRLLGVDVDGTLVWNGQVRPEDAAALRRAAEAGVVVCLCTGRTWSEVGSIWESLQLPGPPAPVVCAGGAIVTEPLTGRTLYSRPFDRPTADDLAAAMHEAGYPVMALVDAWREEFDYFLIGRYEDRPAYQRYFGTRPLRIRQVQGLDRSAGPRAMRISVFADGEKAGEVARQFGQRFAGRIEIQAIHLPAADVHIVEAFVFGTNKLAALTYVGQGYRIGPAATAAIGDDRNDLAMLRGVKLSATTADAPEELRAAATATVAARGRGAVAQFVEMILAGRQQATGDR